MFAETLEFVTGDWFRTAGADAGNRGGILLDSSDGTTGDVADFDPFLESLDGTIDDVADVVSFPAVLV